MKLFRFILVVAILAMATSATAAATIEMEVNGLVCAFCAQGIEKKLRAFPATVDVVVSLEQRLVAVATRNDLEITDDQLRQALTDAGYSVVSIRREQETLDEVRTRLKVEAK